MGSKPSPVDEEAELTGGFTAACEDGASDAASANFDCVALEFAGVFRGVEDEDEE